MRPPVHRAAQRAGSAGERLFPGADSIHPSTQDVFCATAKTRAGIKEANTDCEKNSYMCVHGERDLETSRPTRVDSRMNPDYNVYIFNCSRFQR